MIIRFASRLSVGVATVLVIVVESLVRISNNNNINNNNTNNNNSTMIILYYYMIILYIILYIPLPITPSIKYQFFGLMQNFSGLWLVFPFLSPPEMWCSKFVVSLFVSLLGWRQAGSISGDGCGVVSSQENGRCVFPTYPLIIPSSRFRLFPVIKLVSSSRSAHSMFLFGPLSLPIIR